MSDNMDRPDQGRRRMLAKLGLAAGVAYMTPSLLTLSTAEASPGSRSHYSRRSRHKYYSRGSRHFHHHKHRHKHYSRRSRRSYGAGYHYRERLPWEVWIRLGG